SQLSWPFSCISYLTMQMNIVASIPNWLVIPQQPLLRSRSTRSWAPRTPSPPWAGEAQPCSGDAHHDSIGGCPSLRAFRRVGAPQKANSEEADRRAFSVLIPQPFI